MFSWQVSITSFSTYFLFFGHELIQRQNMVVMNLDDLNVWFQAYELWPPLFQCIMPMAMENLTITWHWDMFCYVIIWGGGWWPWIDRFESFRNYVHLQYMILITLDVIVGCVIFTCVESVVLLSVVVQRLRWSNMEGPCIIMQYVIFLMWMAKFTHFLLLSLLAYDVCYDGNFQGQTLCWFEVEVLPFLSICGHLMGCFTPLLEEILVKTWFFPKCTK
jgi:hypothetical protein